MPSTRCGQADGLAWTGSCAGKGAAPDLILRARQQLDDLLARCPAAAGAAQGQWLPPLEAPALQSLSDALPWVGPVRTKLTIGFASFLAAMSVKLPWNPFPEACPRSACSGHGSPVARRSKPTQRASGAHLASAKTVHDGQSWAPLARLFDF